MLTCPEDGDWPKTNAGTAQTIACGRGYRGEQTRSCSMEGVWGEADRSQCGSCADRE